ncbi:Trihelix transcription factor [Quillaja saponaria]|uniref:Trihelix transcription factor n=1 Tax=Quillaja saponaria TaxID=32244 RepID=A0AAD7M2C9_QUISA|nr:Trihelix transcription factor [Quillaja saponaria]
MADLTDSLTPPTNHSRTLPVREDCWSEEATSTLVGAWGRRYLDLNRGNLRQKDWQDVADAVNVLHGHTKKTHRTDVQCKNRIDTIKKKYKIEKARISSSNGILTSSWSFFERLDALIGSSYSAKNSTPSPPVALPLTYRKNLTPATAVSATAVALPHKRSIAATMDDGYFRRNYSAVAAAAAAAAAEADEDEDDEEEGEEDEEEEERVSDVEEGERGKEGMGRLAKAVARFGEVYERVEAEKLRQMVDLEKQRMQFAKDLEVQRMQMFMETQVQMERIKRGKRSASNGLHPFLISGAKSVGILFLVQIQVDCLSICNLASEYQISIASGLRSALVVLLQGQPQSLFGKTGRVYIFVANTGIRKSC